MTDAFVLGGVRTPVGRYGGSLSHIRTDDLLGQAMVWACERVGVDARPDRGHRRGLREPRARGDGRHRALGGAGRGLSGLGPGRDGQPLLRVVVDLHDPDRARDSRGRARRRPGRRGRVDVAVGLGADEGRRAVHAARPGVHARHDVGRRRRPAEPGAARARRVHRDDADGAERGRPLRADARGDRRLRAALAPARGRRARFGPPRAEIHPVEIPAPAGSPRARSSTTRASATTRRPRSSRRCRRSRTPPR